MPILFRCRSKLCIRYVRLYPSNVQTDVQSADASMTRWLSLEDCLSEPAQLPPAGGSVAYEVWAPARFFKSRLGSGVPRHRAACWLLRFRHPRAFAYAADLDEEGAWRLVDALYRRYSAQHEWPARVLLVCPDDVRREYIDYAGERRMFRWSIVSETLRFCATFLSMLGGAYASIGKMSRKHARRAMEFAKVQARLAHALGDDDLEFSCRLFEAEALNHLKRRDEAWRLVSAQSANIRGSRKVRNEWVCYMAADAHRSAAIGVASRRTESDGYQDLARVPVPFSSFSMY